MAIITIPDIQLFVEMLDLSKGWQHRQESIKLDGKWLDTVVICNTRFVFDESGNLLHVTSAS